MPHSKVSTIEILHELPCYSIIDFDVRLVGGDSEGRVEVYYDRAWGSVCTSSWGADASAVLCRQMGFSGASISIYDGSYGAGNGTILVSWRRQEVQQC